MNRSDSALKRSFNSKPDNTPDDNDRIEIIVIAVSIPMIVWVWPF